MNTEEFVDAIRVHVRDAALVDAVARLENPPGRRPQLDLKLRSDWYRSLSEADAQRVREAMADAVDDAVFGLFAVLDGSRPIADGRFNLFHVDGSSTLLNDPNSVGLNEIFAAHP